MWGRVKTGGAFHPHFQRELHANKELERGTPLASTCEHVTGVLLNEAVGLVHVFDSGPLPLGSQDLATEMHPGDNQGLLAS